MYWAVLLTGLAALVPASVPWHRSLYLGNHGYWPLRLAITVENASDEPVAGESVRVTVPALAGSPAESLRVCRSDGVELLYDLRDPSGRARRTGAIAAEDTLIFPAECSPRGSATVFVYAGNTAAWGVPDFLTAGFFNGSFEFGEGQPEGWQPASVDGQHRVTWEASGGRGGSRCVQVEVDPGASATWVQWQQRNIHVVPGRSYLLEGWVRAKDVTGQAGWYVHVNGEKPQLVNKTLNAGGGTYDWKRISVEFTAPAQARNATIGTVLRGSGRAWFDDASFRPLDEKGGLRISIGSLERMALQAAQARPIPIEFEPRWPSQAEVLVRHFGEVSADPCLVRVDLRPALVRLPGLPARPRVRVTDGNPSVIASFRLSGGADLLFNVSLPPRSERLFRIAFHRSAQLNPDQILADYERLLDHKVNLVANGNMERGRAEPEDWLKPPAGGLHQVQADLCEVSRFGRRSLELRVRRNDQGDWIGWHSPNIPVQPGATYLLSGWLQALGLKSSATIHAHFHAASGGLTRSGAMVSTQPPVSGDSEWENSQAFIQAPHDAAFIRLHLTLNTSGTLRHDGLVLCRVLDGAIRRVQAPQIPVPAEGLHVWKVNPLVKVFPDTPPQAQAQQVAVELAQNEFEPFQLAMRAPAEGSHTNVSIAVSALKNDAGDALVPVKIERVGYVPIDVPSAYYRSDLPEWCRKVPRGSSRTDGWAGWWPDPLLPNRTFNLPPNQTLPLWFTVQAPPDAAPGDYRGTVTIQVRGQTKMVMPLRVKVLPFQLPASTKLKAIFDFRRGRGGWYGPDANSPEELPKWLRFIAAHRLGIDGIEPAPKFDYRNGKVTMDTTDFDETAQLCFDELGMNVSYTPWFFYMFGWAYPPKKLFGLDPFTPEWTDAFRQAYTLFTEHLRKRGWQDKFVYYISDEPHFSHEYVVDQMKKLCALIHSVDRTVPIYSSTWRHCPAWDDSLDLWGVGQYGCFPVEEMRRLQQAGKQMWFTCDGQMATDTPYLATERMLPYYCFKYGVAGFEFWGVSWWTYDPWKYGWHAYIRQSSEGKDYYWVRYPNGDGYLTYPGQPVGVDGPVSTIRLEQVREGLEDYEAITMLAERVAKAKKTGRSVPAGEAALAKARDLVTIPNAGGLRSTEILPNPDRIPQIRRAVNAAILEMDVK